MIFFVHTTVNLEMNFGVFPFFSKCKNEAEK